MVDLGDFPASHTAICIPWDSFAASTGAPSAASNFAAGDIQIYKDGGTTQRSSSAGITVSTTFDTQTGLQMIVIDTSDNSDAGFYAAGHEYQVAVADVTIDGQTVRFWAATFSIERAGGALALAKSATSGFAALKTLIDTIDDFVDTEVAAIKAKTDNLPSDPADASDIAAAFAVTNGKIDVVDDFLDTEIAAIKAKTDNLPSDPADASDIAAAFAVTNGKIDVVDDFLDTEVAAIKAKTDNLPSDPADASDIAALFATVNTKLDTIDDFLDTEVAAIKAKTDNLPSDPADASDIAGAFATVNSTLATIAGYVDTEVAAIVSELAKVPKSDAAVVHNATALAAIADALLNRNLATGTDSGSASVRTMRQAIRAIRNKWTDTAGAYKVYKEDDATLDWEAVTTTDASADPIVGSDPAGP